MSDDHKKSEILMLKCVSCGGGFFRALNFVAPR
jgi:hypothetical protein